MTKECKCGKTYISKTTDLLINGSSQPIALNTADLLGYPKDILLESGQVFSTATNKIISQIGGGASNSVVFNSKLVIDNQIKIVLKISSGKVLGVKYIGISDKRTIVDNIVFTSSDLIPYLLNEERLIVQIYSMCDMSTPDCCDKLPDFTVQSIVNNFCIPPTTTTTTTTTSTTLPPNFCFDNIVFDNLTTTVGTIIGTESGTTWTAGDGISNINFIFQIPEKTFAEFWQASNGLSSPFIINEILIINIPNLLSGQYKLIEKTVRTINNFFGTIDVISHKIICNTTTTTGTTTTGTTTTGTTTTGTTTTGTTTTGTTTTGTTTTGTTTTGTTTTGTTTTDTTTTGTTTTGTTTTDTTTTGTTTTGTTTTGTTTTGTTTTGTTTTGTTTTGTTTTDTTTTGTTTTDTTTTGTTTTGTTTTDTTTTGTTTTGTTTTGTTTTGTTTTGTTTTGTTTTGTTTTDTTTTGTTTTGTTTTGTTTTGTTTTGTTTTGTTTTGTTTTCAPWPQLPCVNISCSYITTYTVDGLVFEYYELEQYIIENPCYSGEEILASQSPCSDFDCLWVSVYDGNNPPAWQFVTGACEAYNNNCGGNCGTCNFPSELPPLEDGIYTSTKCSCVS
jgi:hypothetical protein